MLASTVTSSSYTAGFMLSTFTESAGARLICRGEALPEAWRSHISRHDMMNENPIINNSDEFFISVEVFYCCKGSKISLSIKIFQCAKSVHAGSYWTDDESHNSTLGFGALKMG